LIEEEKTINGTNGNYYKGLQENHEEP